MDKRNDTIAYKVFEQLFNENREMLERIAFFSVRDKEAARDIVSSAFMNLWESRETVAPDSILPYVFVSIRNACLNYRRDSATHQNIHEKIKRREQSAMEFYSRAIESCNPSELFVEDILSICRDRLRMMPPARSAIYLKSRIDGMTYKEIAEAFDISVKKVDKQMQAVLRELKVALSDYLDVFLILSVANMMKIQ